MIPDEVNQDRPGSDESVVVCQSQLRTEPG